ncbi:MAG TPA: RsmE family RNA methyltransferase [Sphaerochaeta sp.]|nr:RsmE family RNA methyltransferase [Sphaerochaeta sp.]
MNIILFDDLYAENSLPADDYRALHIKKVLRLKAGDRFTAGVINAQKGEATLLSMTAEEIVFSFQANGDERAGLYPVTLLVAQVRPISMRRILREAVSLGVGRLVLVSTDTGEKSYAQAKLYEEGEYRSILIDGAMQSGCTGVSDVSFSASVEEALAALSPEGERIVLDNKRVGEPLSAMTIAGCPVVLAIGGERGFSDRERDLFAEHGFRFATLGSRILRTETAVSAGLAVLLGRMGLL